MPLNTMVNGKSLQEMGSNAGMNRRTLFLGLLAPTVIWAQGRGKGKGKGNGKGDPQFRPEEARIITDYYHSGGKLPPGIEKHLRRNGTLPPGLQKKLAPLPVELERRLPPPPPSCHRVVVGGYAVLIADATNVVLDLIDLTHAR